MQSKILKLITECSKLHMELIVTENFAVLNYCGFAKIVKKHDKYTGYVRINDIYIYTQWFYIASPPG